MKRRSREQSRIAILFTLFFPARINPPAVANDEHHRASHTSRTLPMNENTTSGFTWLRIDNAKHARLDRLREMAQSVAGVFLSPRLCRTRRSLFSTLGLPEAVRNYFVYRRRTRAGSIGPDARLRGRRRHTPEPGFNASYGFVDELLERFRCSRFGGCRHGNCDRYEGT